MQPFIDPVSLVSGSVHGAERILKVTLCKIEPVQIIRLEIFRIK